MLSLIVTLLAFVMFQMMPRAIWSRVLFVSPALTDVEDPVPLTKNLLIYTSDVLSKLNTMVWPSSFSIDNAPVLLMYCVNVSAST